MLIPILLYVTFVASRIFVSRVLECCDNVPEVHALMRGWHLVGSVHLNIWLFYFQIYFLCIISLIILSFLLSLLFFRNSYWSDTGHPRLIPKSSWLFIFLIVYLFSFCFIFWENLLNFSFIIFIKFLIFGEPLYYLLLPKKLSQNFAVESSKHLLVLSDTFSEGQGSGSSLAGWCCLKVSREAAVKLKVGAVVT